MSIKTTQNVFEKPAYEGDRILWVEDIAKVTNRTDQCVYGWFRKGTLAYCQMGGRRGAWESDVLAMMQPRRNPAA